MLQTKIVEKIKTHILCSITFLNRKSCRWCDNVENIVELGGGQMTISRTRIECWITKSTHTPHTHKHTHTPHTHTICNTYCTWTATVVARTGLNVMLYVYCLTWWVLNAQLSTDVLKGWHNTMRQYVPSLCFPLVTCFILSLIPCLETYTEKLSLCIVML